MHSCIYQGTVWHRRDEPVEHDFRYRVYLAWIDLSELKQLYGDGYVSSHRLAHHSFRRFDHLFRSDVDLEQEVCGIAEQHTGCRPNGPIRVLTLLRNFGYYFNPLTLYFLYDAAGNNVESVLGEVNNTPWRERHCYFLHDRNRVPSVNDQLRFRHKKAFHVSPFMPMDVEYRWNIGIPGETLDVALENWKGGRRLFQAGFSLTRQPWDRRTLAKTAVRAPLASLRVTTAIYYQAFRLWWKQCPSYLHPSKTPDPAHSVKSPNA